MARSRRRLPEPGRVRLLRRGGLRGAARHRRARPHRRGELRCLGRRFAPRSRHPMLAGLLLAFVHPAWLRVWTRSRSRSRRPASPASAPGCRRADRAAAVAPAGARHRGGGGPAVPLAAPGSAVADDRRLPPVAVRGRVHVAVRAVCRPAPRVWGRAAGASASSSRRGGGRHPRGGADAAVAAGLHPQPARAPVAAGGGGVRRRRGHDVDVAGGRRGDGRVGRLLRASCSTR